MAGLAHGVRAREPLELGRRAVTGSQLVIGASLGAIFEPSTLAGLGGDWLAVVLVGAGTLVLSVLAGLALVALTGLDRPTGLLGLVAGGASGIVAMSGELGADDRLVAFMQYLRVLVVVVLAPLVVAIALGGTDGRVAPADPAGLPADLAFTLAACGLGGPAARAGRVPAASLLGPLVVAAALSASGVAPSARVPGAVEAVAFAALGIQVGLRFTPATLRHVGRLLPWTLGAIVALIVACAGLAALLAAVAGTPYLDAYLATTPGGLYAVLATAVGTSADATFVLAVQTLRLLVMVLAAPPVVRLLAGPRA